MSEFDLRTHARLDERAHPFLLIGMVEWPGMKPWVVHTLAGGLLASRLIHYWGITARKDPGRGIGVTISWLVLAVSGVMVLYQRWGA
ncbi:MAG TPA: MAPEG family protein [Burkholderiales bacterium]|nr:MAPEG family protein [Burkholderiales bacterium]